MRIIFKRDKHLINISRPDVDKKLRYDLKLKVMQRWDKPTKQWIMVKHQYEFFNGSSISDIECVEEKFRDLIKQTSRLNPMCTSLSTFVVRLNDALVYENYIAHDIETECNVPEHPNSYSSKRILSQPLEFYSKNTISFIKKHHIKITCAMEDCFVKDKELMEKIIDVIQFCDITDTQRHDFFEDMYYRGPSFRNFQTLVNDFAYDMKSLIHYLYNYLLPFENIDARDGLSNLKDYYDMSNTIGRNVKKYPKYLRSMHDIITANYNAYKKEYDEKKFMSLRKPELEIEQKKYCIVVPNTTKDIIQEGTDLNHCVSSYVDKIITSEVYIFFMRETKTKEESLITLELIDNKMTQAKGAYNRKVTDDEKKFLKSYCKKLKLGYDV